MNTKKEWLYHDEEKHAWTTEPVSLAELDRLLAEGTIRPETYVVSLPMMRRGPRVNGIAFSSIARLDVDLEPDPEAFAKDRETSRVTVLCGPNNCGKTLYLKQLFYSAGHGSYLLSCNRFSHVDVLNTRQQEEAQYRGYYDTFIQNWYTSRQNTEDTEFKLEQALTGLRNAQREQLFKLCKQFLGFEVSLKRTQEDNEFSPYYVDLDGQNLRYASSGTRLLLTLLGTLLNDRFTTLLIDEPEIGLSPRTQAAVAEFLFDPESQNNYWPHLRMVYLATHSHLFLDRRQIRNNYSVQRTGRTIKVEQVGSIAQFHSLQFGMLGNQLESIFLPSAILIVEGESDIVFLTKVFTVHAPSRRVAVIRGGGDGGVLDKLNVLRETFGDITSSPYRDRVFVLLDSRHSARASRIESLGVSRDNLVVWSKNGIEHYYPIDLLAASFRCSTGDAIKIVFDQTDPIDFNGIRYSKKDLAKVCADGFTGTSSMNPELAALVAKVTSACQ